MLYFSQDFSFIENIISDTFLTLSVSFLLKHINFYERENLYSQVLHKFQKWIQNKEEEESI